MGLARLPLLLVAVLAGCAAVLARACAMAEGPMFGDVDARRPRIDVGLEPVASGLKSVTDIQFPPQESNRAAIVRKPGEALWLDLATGAMSPLLSVPVRTNSELGLLGLAFHPRYAENHRIYVNYNPNDGGPLRTVIAEWTVDPATGQAGSERVLLEVEQPYANHDGGQLAFGPEGALYVGLGDGGSAGDPHGHGQDPGSLLGKLLRIDVDRTAEGRPYAVPADNPFVGRAGFRPEIWAWGLRNPWRFSFDSRGRLFVGDVGQGSWEEIDLVRKGDNLGWNPREGYACFQPRTGCQSEGLVDPIHSYGREEGVSVTGGHVYEGTAIPALRGWYVFGDFGSGRLWALDVRGDPQPGERATVASLGRWAIQPSTFGRAADGTLYVADYARGVVHRLVARR